MISCRLPLGVALLSFVPLAGAEILQFRGEIQQHAKPAKKVDDLDKIPKSDPAGSDLIRFENGDIMHGQFGGLNDGLIWKRPDVEKPIRFQDTGKIRQIIFNGHKTANLGGDISHITLISGDRIPGKINSLNDEELSIESPVIGPVKIAKNLIRSISPNPYGGELLYAGPFNSDGWMRLTYQQAEAEEEKEEVESPGVAEDEKDEEPKPEKKVEIPSWVYSGTSFYTIKRAPLVFDAGLPDVGRIRFKASYKSQMNLSIALHADFTRPIIPKKENQEADAKKEEENDPGKEEAAEEEKPKLQFEKLTDLHHNEPFQSVPWMLPGQSSNSDFFGTSYVLNIYSSYPNLNRHLFNDDGRAVHKRLNGTRSSVALPQTGEVEIDIRFDRKKNLIMLFIDGEYSTQWSDPDGYLAKGSGIGFLNASSSNQIKISDIVVTTWNGVKDSALSIAHPERDVALLTNGTDRFSGKVQRIEDGTAYFKTGYADVEIPLAELSKIELSSDHRADPEDGSFDWEEDPASVVFKPFGLIYLNPSSSTPDTLSGRSPYLGDIKINLKSAAMLRLLEESPDLSDWFEEL